MLNLAIECSGLVPSVGIFDDDRCLVQKKLPEDVGSVRSLAPCIQSLMAESLRLDWQSIHWIGVTVGPGSFTGLRVGLATAKMLAMAWRIPLVGIDSLHAIASQQDCVISAGESSRPSYVVPVLNAFRRQVFTAVWETGRQQTSDCLVRSSVVDAEAWMRNPLVLLDVAKTGDPIMSSSEPRPERPREGAPGPFEIASSAAPVLVTGPGLTTYQPIETPRLTIAPAADWYPRVESVAALAWKSFQAGQTQDAMQLLPNYVRPSAAEEQARSQTVSDR